MTTNEKNLKLFIKIEKKVEKTWRMWKKCMSFEKL